MHRSIHSQAIFCIAAATPPSPVFEPAEKEAWQHTGARKHGAMRALSDGLDTRSIGIVCRMDFALGIMVIALDAM